MTTNKIEDPERIFHHWDENANEWLVVDMRDCRLEACDKLWIKTYRARREGDVLIRPLPHDLTKENSLRFPHCPQRLLRPKAEDSLIPSSDPNTVWFGLDVHDIGQYVKKGLSRIQFLLIPCSALREAKIPSFEDGCTPSASR